MGATTAIPQRNLEELIKLYIKEINNQYQLQPLSEQEAQNVATKVAESLMEVNHNISFNDLQNDMEMKKRLFAVIANEMVSTKHPELKMEFDYGQFFHEKFQMNDLKKTLKMMLRPLCKPDTSEKELDKMVEQMMEKKQDKMFVKDPVVAVVDLIAEAQIMALRNMLGGKNPLQPDSVVMAVLVNNGNGTGVAAQKVGNENSTSAVEDSATYNPGKTGDLEQRALENLAAFGGTIDTQAEQQQLYSNTPKPHPST